MSTRRARVAPFEALGVFALLGACMKDCRFEVRGTADKNFQLLKADPRHASLHLKRIGKLWSVRVGDRYRALGHDVPDGIKWFWIGSHAAYDRIVHQKS